MIIFSEIKEWIRSGKIQIMFLIIVLAEFFVYPKFNIFGFNVRIIDLLAFLFFIFYFFIFRKIKKFIFILKEEKILYIVLLIIFSSTVSTFLSTDLFVSVKKLMQTLENIWLFYFAIIFVYKYGIDYIINSLFVVSIFHILFAFTFQYFTNIGDIYMGDMVRISGLSGGYFATHLLVAFIFALALYYSSTFSFPKLLLSSLLFVSIFLTQIRTIWILLSLLFFFAIFIDFNYKKVKNFIIFIITSGFLCLLLVFVHSSIFNTKDILILEKRKFDTAYIRIGLWKSSFEIFKKYPVFGSGPGTFGNLYYDYVHDDYKKLFNEYKLTNSIDAHSPFFTRLAEIGILGIMAYLCLFAFIFLRLKKMGKKDVLTFAFLLFFVTAFFSDIISDQLGLKLFWIMSGAFIGLFPKKTEGIVNEH